MQCKNCGMVNDADSKFCKECGQKLEATAPPQALTPNGHIKIGELIYTAYKHKEAGEIESAILACQGALALNEASASAHALLGSLYELKGDIAAAIREYGRAVELNPRSDADRQKLEDLRSGHTAPAPSGPAKMFENLLPYWPYVAAVVALFIVLAFGLAMIWTPPEIPEESTKPSAGASPRGSVPQAVPVQPYGPRYPQGRAFPGYQQPYPGGAGPEQRGTTPQAGAPAASRRGGAAAPEPDTRRPTISPPASGPRESSRQPPSREPPVIVPVIETNRKPSQGSSRPAGTVAVSPPKTTAVARTPVEPAGDPEERAFKLQREGKYQEAIAAYRESLNRTSDPGRLYQQIGLCHQRLGQHDLAIDNYNRAISSYRDQLAAGRNPAEVQRNIRSCEAGIQVSRGQAR